MRVWLQGSARGCLREVGAGATPRSSTGRSAPTVCRTNRLFTSILHDPVGREGRTVASLDAPAASDVRFIHRAGDLHLAHPRGSPTGGLWLGMGARTGRSYARSPIAWLLRGQSA